MKLEMGQFWRIVWKKGLYFPRKTLSSPVLLSRSSDSDNGQFWKLYLELFEKRDNNNLVLLESYLLLENENGVSQLSALIYYF